MKMVFHTVTIVCLGSCVALAIWKLQDELIKMENKDGITR